MLHITVDLNTAVCPDYSSPDYTTHREPLVNNSSTHEQAAQLITVIWNSTHIIDCQPWQTQINTKKADTDAQRVEREDEKKGQKKRQTRREQKRKRKKNKLK